MTMLDRVKNLCKERGITVSILEDKLNLPNNTIYQWKSRTPGTDRLEKVADYFDVSLDYLLGRTDKRNYYDLTDKDERDIQKELEKLINNLSSDTGFAAADGSTPDDLDEEDEELLIASLENTLRLSKRLAKKKFTPKKYR